ncbi:MAG TPA: nucleotidyltransferase domain-containing protein [Streptosporangiaceae bacterium]
MPELAVPAVRLPDNVLLALGADPGIARVQLVGSRASGAATARSDWDFAVVTGEFRQIRERLPGLVGPLHPVAAQWDRLSRTWCYMLLLAGPVKVDLIFGQPHTPAPPWQVSAATLPAMDIHFWDWLLWLSAKQAAGQNGPVTAELAKLHQHLLAPLGVTSPPATLAEPRPATWPRAGTGNSG